MTDLDLALRLADIADEISLSRFRSFDLFVATKPDDTPVTDADQRVELALRQKIALERPNDAIIGEEYSNDSDGDRTWIIDPIDGTANFMRGLPIWATLIALRADGIITTSVVSAPALGRRWWANRGNGAFTLDIDGSVRSLQVSDVEDLDNASISYNSLQYWDQSGKLDELISLSRKVWRTRAFGDFLSYMYLAEGALEMVAEHDLKIYDIAALVPIVEEAGGKFSALDGALNDESSSVLATNGKLHKAFQKSF
ncbi:MAG: histidinol phosphatase [Aquiluna sp.]|nr:histidinol phosphatase [Aquiluna sp.]MCF8545341.1 histidinol phosphatase [Aquiluna sp.]